VSAGLLVFEELAGDFPGGEGVAGVVGVDFFYSFAGGNQTGLTGWKESRSAVHAS
jgi:hypothetical protein